jgi:putative transcriptional regulator
MSEMYEGIMEGLNDIIAYQEGEEGRTRKSVVKILPLKEYTNNDIKELRNSRGMTQSVFAELVGVTPKAVEAWESGTNKPNGSAIRLFQLLEDDNNKILEHMLIRR